MLEKPLESPLDCKEVQPVHPKGNQSWIFIRRIDAEAEVPVLWPPDAKSRLIRNTLMLGNIESRRRRRRQRRRWLDGITDSMDMSLSMLRKLVKDREARHAAVHGVTNSRTQLRDWSTTTNDLVILNCFSYMCWQFVNHLWRSVHSSPLPIFNQAILMLSLKCRSSLYILDINPLSDISLTNIFFHSHRLPFYFVDCVLWCTELLIWCSSFDLFFPFGVI